MTEVNKPKVEPVDDVPIGYLPAKKLAKAMKQTVRSRFVAALRLEAMDRHLTRLTAFASSYIIILAVVPYFLKLPEVVDDHINLVGVAIAIVVLASSLLQYSSAGIVKAEQHHRSALEINELHRALIGLENIDHQIYEDFAVRYNGVLQKYSINHDRVDFLAVQLDRPQDYPWVGRLERVSMKFEIWKATALPHTALAVMTVLMAWIVFFYAVPRQIAGG